MVPVHIRTKKDSFVVNDQYYDTVCKFLLEIGIIESAARIPKPDEDIRSVKFEIILQLEQTFETQIQTESEAVYSFVPIEKTQYTPGQEKFLDTPFKKLLKDTPQDVGITERILGCFKSQGITTPRDIVKGFVCDIPNMRNFGKKSFSKVWELMLENDFITV